MMKQALFIWGGWENHAPSQIVEIFSKKLENAGISARIESSLDCLNDLEELKKYALIFPCWTMGSLSKEQSSNLRAAIHSGVALGGIHGGMGDAFRGDLGYEWMVGGHFVGHPYVGDYEVIITDQGHPICNGLPAAFPYSSEQYYMLIDPGVHILAETVYIHEGKRIKMPVAWIKMWGKGRVFYSALGHSPEEFQNYPEALQLTVQGLLWAAE